MERQSASLGVTGLRRRQALLPDHYPALTDGFRSLVGLWERWRGDRMLPDRADFDVLDLRPWIGWLTMVDIVDGGRDYYYRVFASRHAERLGMELTGKYTSQLDFVRPGFVDFLEVVRTSSRPAIDTAVHTNTETGFTYTWRRLGLPLTRGGDRMFNILVATEPESYVPGEPPV